MTDSSTAPKRLAAGEVARRMNCITAAGDAVKPVESPPVLAAFVADAIATTGGGEAGLIPELDYVGVWLATEPPPPDPVLTDTLDIGDKCVIIGPSKARKSFFALQLSMSLAAGLDFLSWHVIKPRRVLAVQLEIQKNHYWRRVNAMAKALGIDRQTFLSHGDTLAVMNCRGVTMMVDGIMQRALEHRADVILIDPLYKLNTGNENDAQEMAMLLASFDRLAQKTGAAVVYVHHDAKGHAGERNHIDRGSGSGVIARDYDTGITITPHSVDENARVIAVATRNYKPQEPFVARVGDDNCFTIADDLVATVADARSRKSRGPANSEMVEAAVDIVRHAPMTVTECQSRIADKFGIGQHKARTICKLLQERTEVEAAKEGFARGATIIGLVGIAQKEADRRTKEHAEKRQQKLGI